MSVDLRRSRSLKDQDLRPSSRISDYRRQGSISRGEDRNNSDKESRISERSDRRPSRSVSFNRDVHVKRYARKLDRQLSRIDESPVETSDDMREPATKTRGRADGIEEVGRGREENAPLSNTKKTGGKEGLTQRIKAFFSGRSKGKKTMTTDDEDDLDKRYKEYRADNDYKSKRRDSAPDAKQSWFRSLERTKKPEPKVDVTDGGRFSRSERNLRYFGESDAERFNSLARNRRSRYLDDTSQDDTTDVDVPNRYGSLVYLHAAAVRDIPPRNGGSRLSVNRDEADASTLRRKTKKSLTRSVSLAGPWTPTHKPKSTSTTIINPNSGGVKESGVQTLTRTRRPRATTVDVSVSDDGGRRTFRSETPIVSVNRPRKLPELVFTGPSIDQTLRREWRGRV
uniref:Putative membrane protein ycf1 n=1 Tax=Lygus hesperus TaxID=30085 RepID=A0A0A9VPR0_LYGHE